MSEPVGGEAVAAARVNGPEAAAAPAGPRWVGHVLVAFGLVILVAFAATTDLRQLARALHGIRPGLLGAAGVLIVLQILVRGMRWRYMIRRLTDTVISPPFAAMSIVAGIAAGSVVPGRTFEMGKAMLLKSSHGTSIGVSTAAMIVERILDLVMIVGALLLAGLIIPHNRIVFAASVLRVVLAAFVAGCVLAAAAPLHVRNWTVAVLRILPAPMGVRSRLGRLIDTLFESILLWRTGPTLGRLLALSGISTTLDLMRVCAVFWGMGVALPVLFIVFTYLGAMVLGMLLLIPGGVGVTEVSQAGLVALFAPAIAPPALIRSAVLADRFLSYYLVVLVGAAFLIAYHRYRHVFR